MCIINFLILHLSLPCISTADPLDGEVVELNEVVVTATRNEEQTEPYPGRITILTSEEISDLPARDAAEALDYIPGLTMDRTGGPGSVVFPSVQGAEYYQTKVLINGIPLNDMANGIGNLGQIPASQIEQIEVLHGGGSTQWGSALGGVINVITKKQDRRSKSTVLLGGGDYSTSFASVNFQTASERISLSIGGDARNGSSDEGIKRQNQSKSYLGDAEIQLAGNVLLNLFGNTTQGEAGSGEYRSILKGSWSNYKYDSSSKGASFVFPSGNGKLRITGYAQEQVQETIDFSSNEIQTGSTSIEDNRLGGSVIWNGYIGGSSLNLGAEGMNGVLESSSLKEDTYEKKTNGTFVNLHKKYENVSLAGGIRQSNEDYYGSFTGFNLGCIYDIQGNNSELNISVTRGYNAPPLAFRYIDISDYFLSNPELTLEEVFNYQIGLKGPLFTTWKYDINGFWADITDAISITTNDSGLSQYRNFKKFRRIGIEASVTLEVNPGLSTFANTLQQEIRDMELDKIVNNKVRSSYVLGVKYKANKLSAMVAGKYEDWNAEEPQKISDKKWLFNTRVAYNYFVNDRLLKAIISINNITNAKLANNEYLPLTPPRQAELSIEYGF
jgi:vitamin B12 transporter